MLLHDSFFYSSNQSINETHYTSSIMAHSPLFHSTLTLIFSIFGVCSNFICFISLYRIISQYKQRKSKKANVKQQHSIHILSDKKYRFLLLLTGNDCLLCFSSIISSLDEKYYSQSLIAHYHFCSFHIFIWKFTLHFIPLLTIFILCRYYYILTKSFPSKYINTTTFTQLLCTDLCILIPLVIALSWSVDGLWLWGEINIKSFVSATIPENHTNAIPSASPITINSDQSSAGLDKSIKIFDSSTEKLICYLQTNDNLDFTARLVYLIQADFLLLFFLHFIGFFLEILLQIRLYCCLIGKKLTSAFLREQQLSLYMLYIFINLTLTSLPFYFYRTIEILLDLHISSNHFDMINSRILAQIILFGASFKPILYLLLIRPPKSFPSIQLQSIDRVNDLLLVEQFDEKLKLQNERSQPNRYSLELSALYPKFHINSRTTSDPTISANDQQSMEIDQRENISITTHV